MFRRVPNVPITKEEVRAVQLSKARIRAGDTIYDIGCGSGSVSVEAALQAGPSGCVKAVDVDQNAIDLSITNANLFGVHIDTIHGEATSVIPSLPPANAVFIGGTGGSTAAIVRMCMDKVVSGGRIVAGTILVETLSAVLEVVQDMRDVDITQVTVLKSRRTSTGTMMLARNPVTIVTVVV